LGGTQIPVALSINTPKTKKKRKRKKKEIFRIKLSRFMRKNTATTTTTHVVHGSLLVGPSAPNNPHHLFSPPFALKHQSHCWG